VRSSVSAPSKAYVERRIEPRSGRTVATTGTRVAARLRAARNGGGV
jgi:hypothetical protein